MNAEKVRAILTRRAATEWDAEIEECWADLNRIIWSAITPVAGLL